MKSEKMDGMDGMDVSYVHHVHLVNVHFTQPNFLHTRRATACSHPYNPIIMKSEI